MPLFNKGRGSTTMRAAMGQAQAIRDSQEYKDFAEWADAQGLTPSGAPGQSSTWSLTVGRMSLTLFPAFGISTPPRLEYILLTARDLDSGETRQARMEPDFEELQEVVNDFRGNTETYDP